MDKKKQLLKDRLAPTPKDRRMALESFIEEMSVQDLTNAVLFLKEHSDVHRISDMHFTSSGDFAITLEVGVTYLR